MEIKNTFTIDVEDYFQVEAFSKNINPNSWDTYECRVEQNTDVILELLDDYGIKSTFFILGWIAKRYPQLIKKIASAGHEIASHGMSHQLIYNQTPDLFRQETRDSKALIEDICQTEILGYRAATYSITGNSLWALDILLEEGFKYDSSIFPMRHDKYGIPNACPDPHIRKTPLGKNIVEFPISTVKFNNWALPVAGGGYFRIFPYFYTRWGLKKLNKENKPFVFYIHPWEVDPEQPRIENISLLSRFRHYSNLKRSKKRLTHLFNDFEFTTMNNVLVDLDLLKPR